MLPVVRAGIAGGVKRVRFRGTRREKNGDMLPVVPAGIAGGKRAVHRDRRHRFPQGCTGSGPIPFRL